MGSLGFLKRVSHRSAGAFALAEIAKLPRLLFTKEGPSIRINYNPRSDKADIRRPKAKRPRRQIKAFFRSDVS